VNVFSACAKALILLLPAFVQAEETVAVAAPTLQTDPMGSAGKVAAFLVLILALIFGLAWLVNKTRAGHMTGNGKQLQMLAVLPLGTKEKIAIIQAGDQQLVIGITPQQITTLSVLDTPISVEQNSPASFSEILQMAAKR
jgi:flagellar protein FliO/FliZ